MPRKPFDVEEIFAVLVKAPFNKSFAELADMTIYQVARILLRPEEKSPSSPGPRRLPLLRRR